MSADVASSVVMVCGPTTEGKITRVDSICNLSCRRVVAAEDTIFALTPEGVYDVFTSSLAVNSETLSIDGGSTHNVLLSAEGDLYAWGSGQWGELGQGPHNTEMDTPGQVRCANRITQLACGGSHSCVVDSFGNVYAWGQNFSRQLGLYTKSIAEMPANCVVEELVMTPRVLPFSVKNSVQKVACGADFSMAITKTGALFTWGAGECGQLGTGRCKVKEVPSQCIITVNGTAVQVKDVACGYGHAGALTVNGDVVVWGLNKHGQLGSGDNITIHKPHVLSVNFKGASLYAKDNSTACVSSGGELYTWGAAANHRLMHGGDCSTVYTPKRVEALSDEKVSEFVFSTNSSAVLIKTRLFTVSPNIGMLKSFRHVELSGCGFWPSTSIVVKFSRCPDPSDQSEDTGSPAALIPPRSCMGQLLRHGVISCKPPRLTHTGYYDVSLAMNGKSFLQETQRVFICTDPVVVGIENCLYDLRESEVIDVTMTCTGLDDVGPGLDVYVRLVNADNPKNATAPILAELLPEDLFGEGADEMGGATDEMSAAGSIRSADSFDENEDRKKTIAVPANKRRILCRNVDLGALKNESGATLMLEAQLSRNETDFAPGNKERIICHKFTPLDAYPNCVPFESQREIIFRGSGFFPLGMQASIAITTQVEAVPIEEATKPKKKGKKGVSRGASSAALSPSPSSDPATGITPISDGPSLNEVGSVMSLASVGSFIMESDSPAFHVMTVPVRFDSISELVITVPGLMEFLRPGLKFPDNMPAVIGAKILFSLASDATASLSKKEVDFYFYRDSAISAAPSICRRFSGQSFTITSVDNWLSFQPNAPKLIFSDKGSGFLHTVDVDTVAGDNGTYQVVCQLPGNDPKMEPAEEAEPVDGETGAPTTVEQGHDGENDDKKEGSESQSTPAVLEQSESFMEMAEIGYKNLRIGLLLDGKSPPEESNMCTVSVFEKVTILELSVALPKEGATKGTIISYAAHGLVSSVSTCIVRLLGVNDKHVDLDGSVGEIDEDTGNGTFSFQMPETLGEIVCHAKGKEKRVFVGISIDEGVSFDIAETPELLVGKY